MADTTRTNTAKKPSVTSHKLFSAVVVVWFAALFGLASLVIRPALIESLVLATGIQQLIPQAAPPLGNTMRMLLSLLMTALGALVGWLVARRIATPASSPATRRRLAEPADEDASAVAAFGRKTAVATLDEDEDEMQPIARRRQQLALLEDEDTFHDHAPLPGNGHILDVAELPLKSFDEVDGIWLHASDRPSAREEPTSEKLYENGFAHDVSNDSVDYPDGPSRRSGDMTADEANGTEGKPNNRLFDSYVRRLNADVGSNDLDQTAPGFVSLRSIEAADGHGEEPVAETAASHSPAPTHAEPTTAHAAYSNAAERIAVAPLDELSHVELLERLALTIARRRAERSQAGETAAPSPVTTDFPAPEETADITALPRFSPPQLTRAEGDMPPELRPHWTDLHDVEDDDALPAYVPLRSIVLPDGVPQKGTSAALAADDAETLEEGYSSLRSMSKSTLDHDNGGPEPALEAPQRHRFAFPTGQNNPAAPTMVGPRVFDSPQTTQPDADQTEQALRAALATLRRMSGTA